MKKKINGVMRSPMKSEASSYKEILLYLLDELSKAGMVDMKPDKNIILDETAYSSYENVMGGLEAYKQAHGKFPDSLVVVGFPFKRQRFEYYFQYIRKHHGPEDMETFYIGTQNPDDNGMFESEAKIMNELMKNGPCSSKLAEKRRERGGHPIRYCPDARSEVSE